MENTDAQLLAENKVTFNNFQTEVLNDYRVACISRETSLLGRKEVLTGKAKFGIFGDGIEIAQVAMAKFFKPGDFRSGYYRDQTFIFAAGMATVEQFFAQLFADPDNNNDPFSGGRQMNAHFATKFVDEKGEWLDLVNSKNCSSDIAPTAGQMLRGFGLAFASKSFRGNSQLQEFNNLSNNGNEVCFTTIGDSATSEGHFWETINAAGVEQIPLAVFVWDNGFGISVPKGIQTVKSSISEALSGFQRKNDTNGINIYKVKGWDYAGMCEVFEEGIRLARENHIPVVFHVEELTQPQGHSTSGSHERYKSAERLSWEKEWDGIKKMREWILVNELATENDLIEIEQDSKKFVKSEKEKAWQKFQAPIKTQVKQAIELIKTLEEVLPEFSNQLSELSSSLSSIREPLRRDVMKTIDAVLNFVGKEEQTFQISNFYSDLQKENFQFYSSHQYNEGNKSVGNVIATKNIFENDVVEVNGFEILNKYFDELFASNPLVLAFGEDLGFIGDVNQGFSGLQSKYGNQRIFDTGIRELTIIGKGIGLALRGLRPFAEIQYLDYLLFGLQPLSDDVATTHYRTKGKQSCPLIVRTRGHRLEGIWHSGSPMGMVINSLRGMHVCVPRNMLQAVGMYNALLQTNDPGLVVECLNGYRLKEKLPSNLLDYVVALGIPEIIKEGDDITIVSYGSTLRIVEEAALHLEKNGISCEIVDVQTLLPFDINSSIVESLKKTNRIVFVDEDMPGGAAAYMFQQVMEVQKGYQYLDVAPRTITAQPHRPAYGSDGDYFCKPNAEQITDVINAMMAE